LEELGIPEDYIPKEYQGGVFIFNRDQNIGMDALAALYLDDQVMDFDLTPNRKDALSMAGSAYENRALFGGEVSRPERPLTKHTDNGGGAFSIKKIETDIRADYEAREHQEEEIKTAPGWNEI